jgi:hypothetical protein
MAGLQDEGFECKIKHFAQPWKYAEGQEGARVKQSVESGHSLKPPE